jgi:hypothetical protein
MELTVAGRTLRFIYVGLIVSERGITDVFANMNSQTVASMIAKPRYAHLARETATRYAGHMTNGIGGFLYLLKRNGDPFYRRFLNPYGDQTYCRFAIKDHLTSRGIYAYMRGSELTYIGRSRDPLAKRIQQGYGKIHPRNCYLDGQATNCHLNALIAEHPDEVSFHVLPMDDSFEIIELERTLITQVKPSWNIALARERRITL